MKWMPVKDDMELAPNKVGLSNKDIIYLFIYRELERDRNHRAALYEMMKEAVEPNLLKSKAHFYQVVEEMERSGWIVGNGEKRLKLYNLTEAGKLNLNNYREAYLQSFLAIQRLSNHLIALITGGAKDAVPEIEKKDMKLFNKLINVKELTVYLFLQILYHNHGQLRAKDIYETMESVYGWTCSNGYLYETAHAIEDSGMIDGKWEGKRRSDYYYLLTELGESFLPKAAENALYHIRKCRNFNNTLLSLLQEVRD